MSKDGTEIAEILSGVPEPLQPLYKEVITSATVTVNNLQNGLAVALQLGAMPLLQSDA